MKGFRDTEAYEWVSREEALSEPTRQVVRVRWVDHNSARPDVRSRLVAQPFATTGRRDDLFSVSPLWAVTRLLLAGLACGSKGEGGATLEQHLAHRRE